MKTLLETATIETTFTTANKFVSSFDDAKVVMTNLNELVKLMATQAALGAGFPESVAENVSAKETEETDSSSKKTEEKQNKYEDVNGERLNTKNTLRLQFLVSEGVTHIRANVGKNRKFLLTTTDENFSEVANDAINRCTSEMVHRIVIASNDESVIESIAPILESRNRIAIKKLFNVSSGEYKDLLAEIGAAPTATDQ